MIRLIAVCLSLPLIVGSAVAAERSQSADSASKHSSVSAEKQETSHHAKRHAKASPHKGAKRPEYRPEYGENSVEVINGDATKKVVFRDEQKAAAPKGSTKTAKDAPSLPMRVEVMNGASTDTQYFSGSRQDGEMAAVRNQPVVIGVQSSNTRTAGGHRHPVVTSVNSAEMGNAKITSGGGDPVTNGVSPRPKRPEYRPDIP